MENTNQQSDGTGGKIHENKFPAADPWKFKTITDAVEQLIWENSPVGDAIYFNRKWFEFSGLSYEESLGAGWVVMAHPDDDHAIAKWRQSLSAGEPFKAEVRLRRHDNRYVWHLLRNTPLKNENGKITGWFGTATDIDEQKNNANLYHETSTRLRAILEAAIDFAVITLDKNGVIIDWNSGAEQMFGYAKEEAVGRTMEFLFTPEDIEAGIPAVEIKKANETGEALDERWHLRKDNTRFFMSGVLKPIRHSLVSGFVKVTREITDRKLAEEALLLSEQHKSLAVQSAQMGEWNYDLVADVIKGDEQSQHWLGVSGEHSCTLADVYELIHHEDRQGVKEELQKALNGINIFHSEFRVKHSKLEGIRWVSVYGRVVGFEDGKPAKLIGVIYDITSRKLLEKQKDDFISIASHELKSPVTSIRAYSELLEEAFAEKGDHEHAGLVRKLNTQVDRLVRLIHNLLDASSLSAVSMKLKPERFDINQLIAELLSGFELSPNITRLTFKPSPIPDISADPERIGQVIQNLITNALKYSPDDKEIIITTEDMLEAVKVSVQDFGIGIPAHEQPYIFDRYYRIYDENAAFNQGLGLGLYIAAEIVRQHFGTLGVESLPGEGSTFYFTLPYT